jgi:outer membrane biosynthesis protein TonB
MNHQKLYHRSFPCAPWLLLLSALVSGCAHAQAKSVPDGPPLDVPSAPPRIVEPIEAQAPEPPPLPEEPARRAPAPARPRPTPPREAARPEPARQEPAKPEVATTEPAKPSDEAARPPTTLQTTPAAAEGDVERGIRATLTRATNDLNRIDYRALNADARTQYDTAKRFVRQAEDAIRTKNLVFAKNLADKAAGLAAQLAAR